MVPRGERAAQLTARRVGWACEDYETMRSSSFKGEQQTRNTRST